MKEQIEKLKRIYNHYGQVHQLEKLKEECTELIEAIENYLENRNCQRKELLLGEIADVNVLIKQFKIIETNNQIINSIMKEKIERQLQRMENEECSKSFCCNCIKEVSNDIKECECGGRTFVFGDLKVEGKDILCKCGNNEFRQVSHSDYIDKAVTSIRCTKCGKTQGHEYCRSEEERLMWED